MENRILPFPIQQPRQLIQKTKDFCCTIGSSVIQSLFVYQNLTLVVDRQAQQLRWIQCFSVFWGLQYHWHKFESSRTDVSNRMQRDIKQRTVCQSLNSKLIKKIRYNIFSIYYSICSRDLQQVFVMKLGFFHRHNVLMTIHNSLPKLWHRKRLKQILEPSQPS